MLLRCKLILLAIGVIQGQMLWCSKPAVYRAENLKQVLNLAKVDSVEMLQRKAALHFHHKLNLYRHSLKLDTLVWDEALWLAAMNHCTWMIAHHNLTHNQEENTAFFTGVSPGARVAYVAGQGLAGYGENALYNYSVFDMPLDSIAKHMAVNSFEQWKASPGHDQNMRSSYGKHGVAFMLDHRTCWGVDIFAFGDEPIVALEKKISEQKPSEVIVNQISSSRSVEKHFVKSLYKKFPSKKQEGIYVKLQQAAQRHARYLLLHPEEQSFEKRGASGFYARTPYLRLLKASAGLSVFRKKPTELYLIRSYDLKNFQAEQELENLTKEIEALGTLPGKVLVIEKQRKKATLTLAIVLSGFEQN